MIQGSDYLVSSHAVGGGRSTQPKAVDVLRTMKIFMAGLHGGGGRQQEMKVFPVERNYERREPCWASAR